MLLLSPTITSHDSSECCRFACWCRLHRQCGLPPFFRIVFCCGNSFHVTNSTSMLVICHCVCLRLRLLRWPPRPSRPLRRPLPPSLRPCVWPLLLTWVWRVEIVDISDCICSIILWFCWVALAISLSCCCICCSAMA